MKPRNNFIISIFLLFTIVPCFVFAQEELYYWGYKTKQTLTTDSLQVVAIPKKGRSQSDYESLIKNTSSKSISELTNRQEVKLQLKNASTLRNNKIKGYDLLPIFKKGDYPLIPTGEIVFHPKANVYYQQVLDFVDNKMTIQKISKYGTVTVSPNNIEFIKPG